MTVTELKLSRALHVRRHRFASSKLARLQRAAHTDDAVTAEEARTISRLQRRVREERALVDRRDAQLAAIQVGRGALFLPGVERVPGHDAGTFVPSPPKLVWHTTEGSSIEGAIGAYRQHNSWPHFTLDPQTGRLVQHLPLNRAGRSLEHRCMRARRADGAELCERLLVGHPFRTRGVARLPAVARVASATRPRASAVRARHARCLNTLSGSPLHSGDASPTIAFPTQSRRGFSC
jgi:hypothetical protein